MASEQGHRRSQRLESLKRKRNDQPDGSGKTGSPSDQIQRKNLTIENIDYNKSYVEEKEHLPVARISDCQAPSKPNRWKYWGKKMPLNDPAKLPKNWTMDEFDLDEEWVKI